jgi:diguanylate cyclase (GGDEF)-like protein
MRLGTEVEDSAVGEPSREVRRIAARLATLLERCSPAGGTRIAGVLVIAAVIIEVVSRLDVSLLFLYVAPVALAAWVATPRTAYALVFIAVSLPSLFSVLAGRPLGWGLLWSTSSDLALLGVIVLLLTVLKRRLSDEAAFAATDALTGLPNRGSFMARLDAEIARASRYGGTFALAYVDLDNFKAVNDLEGHDTGDELLRRTAHALQPSTRQTDVLGRLGGDEFAVILPETQGGATSSVLGNLLKQLIRAMAAGGWPVTFSIGAVTFEGPISASREALQVADEAMYSVKRSGKDGILHVVWDGDPLPIVRRDGR